jgi:peptide/nickel transport system substrate-binding protein
MVTVRRSRIGAVAGALALACAAVGCSAAGTTTDQGASTTGTEVGLARPGGTLSVGVSAETDNFNPFVGQWSAPSYEVANAVFEPLAAVDDQGIARPYLAESFTPAGDLMSWTITTRPDVTFQNGEKFDAAALKKNLDTARASGLAAQVFTLVTSVDMVSDRAVTVTLSAPWATFPATLAMQAGYMAAPAMLDDPAGANAIPIGTGPFTVQYRQRDSFVKTRKNPTYWRTDGSGTHLPYLDAVDFNVIPDTSSRGNALAAGTADGIDVQTPDALTVQRDAAHAGHVQMLTNDGTETDEIVLALNTSRPPFDDPIARRTLASAIDQDKLASTAFSDAFPGAWGMFEPSSPYFISRGQAGYPEPDAAKAQQLAQQYEQAHGQPLEFAMLLPSDPQYLAIGQAFQAELSRFGIKVDLQAIEQTQLIRTVVATGDYQSAGFLLRSAPSPDQAYIFLATKANASGLSLNFSRYDDPDLTAAMNDFRAAGDAKTRIDAITKVQQELAKNLQMIFLVHSRSSFVYQNDVHGLAATTYPGTDKPAFAPYPNTPFYAFAWKDPTG